MSRIATLPTRLVLIVAAALLGGCATLNSVTTNVSSFGEWPAGRAPGSYAFERLPSQQARAAESDALEASARGALAQAGFKPVAEGQEPEVLVQVGALEDAIEQPLWDDPFWWHGGFGWRHGPWGPPPWGGPYWGGPGYWRNPRFASEVAVLIRDRASGKPLYETHASTETLTRHDGRMLAALFSAALMDFPRLGMNPRPVVVQLPP